MTPATDPTAATSDPAGQPERAALRRSVYGMLIALAAGNMAGRILAVNSVIASRRKNTSYSKI